MDALRGVAILLVLAHHCVIPESQSGLLRPVVAAVARLGWSGVDLFFVLSGFLIGGLLLTELRQNGRIDVRRFLVRRGFKIWPSYYVYLAYVFVFTAFVWGRGGAPLHVAKRLVPNLLHLQNYLGSLRVHTWSLAVEEHFYLLLPFGLAFFGASRLRLRRAPWVAAACVLFIAAARSFAILGGYTPSSYFTTHHRLDSLLFGVLLAYLSLERPELTRLVRRWRSILFVAGLMLVSPMLFLSKETAFVQTVGFSFLYMGYGGILLAAVSGDTRGATSSGVLMKTLGFVGYFSYAIYLWFEDLGRTPVGYAVGRGLLAEWSPEGRWVVAQGLFVLLAIAAGAAFSLAIEKPALALRDRLFPGHTQVPAPPLAVAPSTSAANTAV